MAWTGNGGEKQGKWTPEWQRKKQAVYKKVENIWKKR